MAPQGQFSGPPRRPPLGPPPSARRGPSSYYSQISTANVHPIVEESDSNRGSVRNPSMHSFASSNAIPIGIPDYYLDNRDSGAMSLPPMTPGSEYASEGSPIEPTHSLRPDALRPRREEEPSGEEFQAPDFHSPPQRDYSPDAMPVRQASLGKRSKPTLTTVKSGDKLRTKSGTPQPDQGVAGLPSQQKRNVVSNSSREIPMIFQTSRDQPSEKEVEAGASAAPVGTVPLAREVSRESPGSFLDSSSESDKSTRNGIKKVPSKELLGAAVPQLKQQRYRERSPLAPREDEDDDDALRKEVLGGLKKGGAISASQQDTLKPPAAGLSAGRAGKPRPARLNVDAVRDAEARGSLTSLPDLIKRATKLASNLDRGRTASRLGMSEWLAASNGEIEEKDRGNVRKSAGSLSDILHSFPQPGENSDRRSHTMTWSSMQRHSALPSDSDAGGPRQGKKQGRRCCGMPLWLFLVLLVFLVCLVAAAIIVPVVLVVVPKQNDSSSTTESSTARQQMAQCANKDLNCANGGQVVSAPGGGDCRCLCVNGFTGSTCSKPSQAGCTTMALGSMTSDATVGDSIPRVVDGAASNFSIPLDSQTLLGLFSSFDLSCSSENALVTFQGKSQRRDEVPTPTSLFARDPQGTSADSPNAAVTSNGIVFESGSPSASSSSSQPTQTSATPSATPSSSSSDRTSQTNLDFARTAVLYILQSSSQLSSATTAQGNLQSYFSTGSTSSGQPIKPANISLGNGWTADLERFYIVGGNGTQVGGGGGGS